MSSLSRHPLATPLIDFEGEPARPLAGFVTTRAEDITDALTDRDGDEG
jgi:hypothetical protein